MKRIVIISATSLIAEHCARLWVKDNALDITLVGRNLERLEIIAKDLQVRSPHSQIKSMVADFQNPEKIQKTVDEIFKESPVDVVLIAQGFMPPQTMCQTNLSLCRETLEITGISPVLYAEAVVGHMQKQSSGTLALIGSVAGDRGRKANYIYGSAKSLINNYMQGLQHRFAASPIKIVLIKPGPTDTPMTTHAKIPGLSLAPVEVVANKIVDGITQGQAVVYAPKKWQFIMWVVKHMPNFIFHKLNI